MNVIVRIIVLLILLCIHPRGTQAISTEQNDFIDLVIFSFDRPMQLYAFLESYQENVTGTTTLHVLYRTSNDAFEEGYRQVANAFPYVTFVKQGDQPYRDFKQNLLTLLFTKTQGSYFLLAVDDLVITAPIDLKTCIAELEAYKAHGFFLRLGLNITECYTIHKVCNLPPFTTETPTILTWNFNQGDGDWSLPVSTDMTVYRKKDVEELFNQITFYTPNDFEARWMAATSTSLCGICFHESKVVSLPLNIVQPFKTHRNMNFFSCEELLAEFTNGYKLDTHSLSNLANKGPLNKAPHFEYVPEFIKK